ncbi:MAG: class I SAM-dependent methyltransferase [Hydrogenophilaceae bacterium]|nr:class I SAM-dependent methyltransferase [Hydrogenophilaceae bacterium]
MLKTAMLNNVQARIAGLPVHVTLWDGGEAGHAESASVHIRLNSPAALTAFIKPTLGSLARAYVEGEMDLDGNPRDVLALGSRLCSAELCRDSKGSDVWKWWRHTRSRDRKNIQYHYDISNDFYGLWLDARRVYSCAYYRQPDMTLEAAQEAKLDHICKKLALKPGERFLDIGCGWGGLVFWAAEHYGVKALGITLSDNQHDFVSARIKALGLQDRVEVRVLDYRDVPETGCFDKIASIGMVEHVGRKNLTAYFRRIFDLLRPGGLLLNHGITTAAPRSQGLGSGISEFVDEYVFPGGELEHVSEVMQHATTGGLECLDAENLRPHYARTLWEWVRRLDEKSEEARKLIGERKYRIWRIYMAGSAHAFDQGWLELWQVLAGKPLAPGVQPNYPYRRDYIYC